MHVHSSRQRNLDSAASKGSCRGPRLRPVDRSTCPLLPKDLTDSAASKGCCRGPRLRHVDRTTCPLTRGDLTNVGFGRSHLDLRNKMLDDNVERHLNKDSAAITGHRRGPRLRSVVRSTMDRPGLMMLVVLMLVVDAVVHLRSSRGTS